MPVRKTPRIYEAVRPLYEEAVHDGNKIRQMTIELDNQIKYAQQQCLELTNLDDMVGVLKSVDKAAAEALGAVSKDHGANFTDFNRLLSTSRFAIERILMPILFGANTRRTQKTRERLADGTESRSIEPIEIFLNEVLPIFSANERPHDIERIRGAIQEATATALLNYRQDGQFIVMPASLEDDMLRGTDLDAYYMAQNGKGYKTPISIKSSTGDAIKEKRQRPHLVVISASDFDNQDLSISRLLVRQNVGAPGLSKAEEAKLNAVRQVIYQVFCDQVAERAQATELPRHPAREIIQKLHEAAIAV